MRFENVLTLPLYILALLPFYVIGSFPTGYLVGRRQGITLWDHGSGNVGATNVTRVLGKSAGIITLLADITKGALAPALAYALTHSLTFCASAAITVVAGHCFSIPKRFKGGKGVATAFGALLILCPIAALPVLFLFVVVLLLSKIVALASLAAALGTPVITMLCDASNSVTNAMTCIGVIIFFRHRSNIRRLLEGNERSSKSTEKSSTPGQ